MDVRAYRARWLIVLPDGFSPLCDEHVGRTRASYQAQGVPVLLRPIRPSRIRRALLSVRWALARLRAWIQSNTSGGAS